MKYYVYELVNSLTGKIFYVGKGSGNRMYVHEHRARRNHAEINENRKLRNKILSIWNKGGTVIHNQIFHTNNDMEAYNKETDRIKEIGIENLCNVFISPPTPSELYHLRSLQMRGQIVSEEIRKKISKTLMGHSVSQTTRQKISERTKGVPRPCTESKRILIANARRPKNGFPKLISPNGELVSIIILTDFCKTYGLRISAMSDLLHGRVKSCKGWRIHIPQSNTI